MAPSSIPGLEDGLLDQEFRGLGSALALLHSWYGPGSMSLPGLPIYKWELRLLVFPAFKAKGNGVWENVKPQMCCFLSTTSVFPSPSWGWT